MQVDSALLMKSAEWLEKLMFDGEYGDCGGCRFGSFYYQREGGNDHEPSCDLKATIDALKRASHNTRRWSMNPNCAQCNDTGRIEGGNGYDAEVCHDCDAYKREMDRLLGRSPFVSRGGVAAVFDPTELHISMRFEMQADYDDMCARIERLAPSARENT